MEKQLDVVIDSMKLYGLQEAVEIAKRTQRAKFIETLDLSVKLGIDPKRPEQQIRGSFALPHGTGRKRTVIAIVNEKEKDEAQSAGADVVGGEELIDKIQEGWLEFDVLITTPEVLPKLGRVGKILGTKGLMPTIKYGTVTKEIGKTIEEFKKGKVSFKSDKFGLLNVPMAKSNFSNKEIENNIKHFMKHLSTLRPTGAKGQFIRKVAISLTMGPGIRLDTTSLQRELSSI